MKCPNCNVNLLMTERNGVEIDYCPDCRGVWLDRGELDKIIERAAPGAGDVRRDASHHAPEQREKHHGYDNRPYEYKKKKKESFLEDLFDF